MTLPSAEPDVADHSISIVIPVYQGERTLTGVLEEIEPLTRLSITPDGYSFRVEEVLLVFDHGPDDSASIIRSITDRFPFARGIWLSKNFGQHAATLAGMASSGGDWIVTLDEDGQHDPRAIGGMLDTAMREQASVVYAKPTNPAPHGPVRNAASKTAKYLLTKLSGTGAAADYQSYRLMLGNIGRSVAAYAGSGVYLDVAIGWVASRVTTSPVELREEGERSSGYSARRLFSHFWRMILTTGTRGLRIVSGLGVIFAVIGVIFAIVIFIQRLAGDIAIQGWASLSVLVLLSAGFILFSLGIIAEYIGINVNMAMGKPPYLITTDPADGPLGRTRKAAK
ncbi:glycosyltransferase [Cryobacterium sp. N22]|uniref:glycosyltransferase n=1 Tax=Cryobacterium sp. N22 TaxID=2048290 RepID=UPI001E3D2C0D|nr:glycosyltransferase [Cryobacterium sp. N22]